MARPPGPDSRAVLTRSPYAARRRRQDRSHSEAVCSPTPAEPPGATGSARPGGLRPLLTHIVHVDVHTLVVEGDPAAHVLGLAAHVVFVRPAHVGHQPPAHTRGPVRRLALVRA